MGHLIHDVLTKAAKDGDSIEKVCEFFWRKHKKSNLEITAMCKALMQNTTGQDAPPNPADFRWWKLLQMNEHEKYRPATVKKRSVQVLRKASVKYRPDLREAACGAAHEAACGAAQQIIDALKLHDGEVRTWPTHGLMSLNARDMEEVCDVWVPVRPNVAPRLDELLRATTFHSQLTVHAKKTLRRWADCGWTGAVSKRECKADDCFSEAYETRKSTSGDDRWLGACKPNFDDAISTVAVLDTVRSHVCMREARGVTLGELFYTHGHDYSYTELYSRWRTGHTLLKARPFRGNTKKNAPARLITNKGERTGSRQGDGAGGQRPWGNQWSRQERPWRDQWSRQKRPWGDQWSRQQDDGIGGKSPWRDQRSPEQYEERGGKRRKMWW